MSTLVGAVLRVGRALHLVAKPATRTAPLAARGPTSSVGRDPAGLTTWQATRAAIRLAALRADDRRDIQQALTDAAPRPRPTCAGPSPQATARPRCSAWPASWLASRSRGSLSG